MDAHTPLLIVHCKTLLPLAIAVTFDVDSVGDVIVAVPDITDHKPVPEVAGLPANVVVFEQIV